MINIKKVVFIILSVFLLTGCMNNTKDLMKSFKDYNGKKNSYELTGEMVIVSNEDEFTYNIKVGVDNKTNYKVSLVNTINNHEQVILKNSEGVYVVTPNLNKSFKFMSEWPSNSSQAYLIESLINDVNNDAKATIKEINGGYEIDSSVNYPNNQKLERETIITDKKFDIKEINVKNSEGVSLLKVKVNSINYSPKFDSSYFKLDTLVKETDSSKNNKTTDKDTNKTTETTDNKTTEEKKKTEEDCISTCSDDKCKDKCKKTETTGNVLDDIIYPLYVPTDTYLHSKDKVSTDDGERVILTFAGVDPFILVEEASKINDEMEIVPVNGEPVILGNTIGALGDNSVYWSASGVDFYLTSNTLNSSEMMTIAESITNGTSLVARTK